MLDEKKEEYETEAAEKLNAYNSKMKNRKLQQINVQDEEQLPVIPTIPEFDEHSAMEEIREEYLKNRKKPGLPILVPRLEVDENLITNEVDIDHPEEKKRRFLLLECSFYCKLFVNGKFLTRTKPKGFQGKNSWEVDISELFTMKVVKWPDNIRVEIWSSPSPGGKESLLSDFLLRVTLKGTSKEETTPILFASPNPFISEFSRKLTPQGEDEGDQQNAFHLLGMEESRKYRGVFWVNVGWTENETGRPVAPPVPLQ
jgi:hypothetical protein